VWQLAAIARILDRVARDRPIAILGSTPEFRDLLADLHFDNIHIFERNLGFYRATTRDRIHQNKEFVVPGHWPESLNSTQTRYAAILSDLTSGNVDYTERERFYTAIAHVLEDTGLFLDRILCHSIPHETLDALSQKYDQLPINLLTVNRFSCEFLFCSELLRINNTVDTDQCYFLLRKELQSRRLQKFLELCPLITPEGCVWWYGRSWRDLAPDYEKHLEIISVIDEPCDSPYARRARMLISRRRNHQ
jgi:hypothetical protein